MYTYSTYGLVISSPIRLPELSPWKGDGDVQIHISKDEIHKTIPSGQSWELVLGNKYSRFFIDNLGTFEVQDGCEIIISPAPGE